MVLDLCLSYAFCIASVKRDYRKSERKQTKMVLDLCLSYAFCYIASVKRDERKIGFGPDKLYAKRLPVSLKFRQDVSRSCRFWPELCGEH